MSFIYSPLWKQLIDRKLTKKTLRELTGISKSTFDKMYREEYVSLEIIDRICTVLNCSVSDVIEHKKEFTDIEGKK